MLNETESDNEEEDKVPIDISHLLGVYKESDPQGRLIILSLVDHKVHTRNNIMEYFSCTKYAVDQARKLCKSSKGLVIPTKAKIHRNRLNLSKCEHFLEFLFSSGMVQDVAYGVAKVHFDSGSVQTIPNAILTTKPCQIDAYA